MFKGFGWKKGEGLLDLHHGLTAADKLSGPVLQDLDLVAAYLAMVDFIDFSQFYQLILGTAEYNLNVYQFI